MLELERGKKPSAEQDAQTLRPKEGRRCALFACHCGEAAASRPFHLKLQAITQLQLKGPGCRKKKM